MLTKNIGFAFRNEVFTHLTNPARYAKDCTALKEYLLGTGSNRISLDNLATDLHNMESVFPQKTTFNIAKTAYSYEYCAVLLTTRSSGLMVGLGYSHRTKTKAEDEFKMGFYFDPSSGIPVIPGSSIKGRLRSFFPGRYKNKELRYRQQKIARRLWADLEVLAAQELFDLPELTEETQRLAWLLDLENKIFEAKSEESDKRNNPTHFQDRFLEAYPSESIDDGLFEAGIITPHKHPLKDPVPLLFLKIKSGVSYKFQFVLNNWGSSITSKRNLFKFLLQKYGMGAKTSNGFGQFHQAEPKLPGWVQTVVDSSILEDYPDTASEELNALEEGAEITVMVERVEGNRVYFSYGKQKFAQQFKEKDLQKYPFYSGSSATVIFNKVTSKGTLSVKIKKKR